MAEIRQKAPSPSKPRQPPATSWDTTPLSVFRRKLREFPLFVGDARSLGRVILAVADGCASFFQNPQIFDLDLITLKVRVTLHRAGASNWLLVARTNDDDIEDIPEISHDRD